MAAIACVVGAEVERKFVVGSEGAAELRAALGDRVALEVHDRDRPIAWTRTTYLDTDGLDYFRSDPHLRLRVREYAASRDLDEAPVLTGRCFLELKESRGTERRKLRAAAPAEVLDALVRSHGAIAAVGAGAALSQLAARLRQDRPRARVTTWYRRASYVDPLGRVRVTFDQGIEFGRPVRPGASGSSAWSGDPIGCLPGQIVEVKVLGPPPGWLAQAMRSLPASRVLSKFTLAMRALGVPVTSAWGARLRPCSPRPSGG